MTTPHPWRHPFVFLSSTFLLRQRDMRGGNLGRLAPKIVTAQRLTTQTAAPFYQPKLGVARLTGGYWKSWAHGVPRRYATAYKRNQHHYGVLYPYAMPLAEMMGRWAPPVSSCTRTQLPLTFSSRPAPGAC